MARAEYIVVFKDHVTASQISDYINDVNANGMRFLISILHGRIDLAMVPSGGSIGQRFDPVLNVSITDMQICHFVFMRMPRDSLLPSPRAT